MGSIVENLSLFALIYLARSTKPIAGSWESFIIRLDILKCATQPTSTWLRIFHYSPWYTYEALIRNFPGVENLSLFALIYLLPTIVNREGSWESFIIRLDILTFCAGKCIWLLRIFHYSPWYTYPASPFGAASVENLSLFALIYLTPKNLPHCSGWESFIIRLDILIVSHVALIDRLRIFHYSPWYT